MAILKFQSKTCNPCKQLSKVLEELNVETKVVDIATDEGKTLVDQYGIRAVPTLVDEKSKATLVGLKTKEEISLWLLAVEKAQV